ncbi:MULTISPECIES: methylenetetrahydrofolate reductase [NAD(P)H] [Halanaerobium]|jgi:methylenetetrahydrofolate reductase (NADPH)|uniref:Methylenetetrahydrofolate reductase n=1 Tax=Halanaerobium kushneri TaxID=56779 RepID=A0A1N6UZK4_9FIRM|nr:MULTISPECIES: methylenetetrahydrofolate reductase [NAD(P)H] [Halanaerobium]RCW58290.1 5,10-methylenetetrahydrofolate reductase (NAD(P)) [Halanaerobium sp. ST460_2HS_T2]SIQ71030.1 5,10-methylenetetrahydrofolate reductase (NAD(P)) [Halanaerobium kushneri]
MKIKSIFDEKEVVFSLEVFPPRADVPIENIYQTLEELKDIDPDYISVTYGAGGGVHKNRTCELSSIIKEKYKVEALAHLTCINSDQRTLNKILARLKAKNIDNVLALRGDKPVDGDPLGDYNYAYQLVEHIKQQTNFGIAAACYPEGHLETESLDQDIEYLKQKVDYGVDYLISQMFFDNSLFYKFRDKVEEKGINVPIEAGIMPVINKKQVGRIIELSDAYFPDKFQKILDKYEDNPEALRDAGIAYAVEQIVDLISSEVDGIHLYTMNNPYVARRIKEAVGSLITHINGKKVG